MKKSKKLKEALDKEINILIENLKDGIIGFEEFQSETLYEIQIQKIKAIAEVNDIEKLYYVNVDKGIIVPFKEKGCDIHNFEFNAIVVIENEKELKKLKKLLEKWLSYDLPKKGYRVLMKIQDFIAKNGIHLFWS